MWDIEDDRRFLRTVDLREIVVSAVAIGYALVFLLFACMSGLAWEAVIAGIFVLALAWSIPRRARRLVNDALATHLARAQRDQAVHVLHRLIYHEMASVCPREAIEEMLSDEVLAMADGRFPSEGGHDEHT